MTHLRNLIAMTLVAGVAGLSGPAVAGNTSTNASTNTSTNTSSDPWSSNSSSNSSSNQSSREGRIDEYRRDERIDERGAGRWRTYSYELREAYRIERGGWRSRVVEHGAYESEDD
jgi:hypothetical protein